MPRQSSKLSAIAVTRIKKPGLHSDGAGLYLRVTPAGGRFWAFRFMLHGRAREMGLGALHTFSLAEARSKAADCRKLLSDGIDPILHRDAGEAQKRLEEARTQTFRQCAEAYIEMHRTGWRNAKHAAQWVNTLTEYVYPVFGDLPVQDIDVALVLKVLEPIWKAIPETASRISGRIETILDWATTREYRRGENPARWRGHLENLLPHRSKIQRIKHRPALPYDQISGFVSLLQEQDGTAALALIFAILTAARTGEVIGARWQEFDLQQQIWTVPANRIKGGREHRVPLSEPAMRILHRMQKEQQWTGREKNRDGWVFSGRRPGKPLSNMAMLALLKRIDRHDITVHGFRSTFRDWCAEQTNFPYEVAKASIAHTLGDKVEAAYLRSDFFDKRRQLMNAWARYCYQQPSKAKDSGKIVSIAGR